MHRTTRMVHKRTEAFRIAGIGLAVAMVCISGCSADRQIDSTGADAAVNLQGTDGSIGIVGSSFNSNYLPVVRTGTKGVAPAVLRLNAKLGTLEPLTDLPTTANLGDSDAVTVGDDVVLSATLCAGEPIAGDAGVDCSEGTIGAHVFTYSGATKDWTDLGATDGESYLPIRSIDGQDVTLGLEQLGEGFTPASITSVRTVHLGPKPTMEPSPDYVPAAECGASSQIDSPSFPDRANLRRVSFADAGLHSEVVLDPSIVFPASGQGVGFLMCAGAGEWFAPSIPGPLSEPLPSVPEPIDIPSATRSTVGGDSTQNPPTSPTSTSPGPPKPGSLQLVSLKDQGRRIELSSIRALISMASGDGFVAIDASNEIVLKRDRDEPVHLAKRPIEQLRSTSSAAVLFSYGDGHKIVSLRAVA
ncbi:MAG: hypothetical protein EKK60_10355 [Gordonia sp. (in: high G+C Gram-positive bacteria)]|nr:MAG: hypothetical protein EKK60_10355 [Gordonia sp. (in: high G+C Gram-positive bacteria)]